jgi:hypothetical protein
MAQMEKWRNISRLVNTIDEARKRLVEELQSLEFETRVDDATPFYYGTYKTLHINTEDGRLRVKEALMGKVYMTSVSNLQLHEVFMLAEELLARRERLRGAGDAGA